MIPRPLDKIEAADILALVANREEERRTIDFKRELPGNADKDRNELRADVTSFANASGGDLIFGVAEEAGVATAVPGLVEVDADAEIRRIESMIQSSVDPRVPGVESRKIDMPGGAPVILVRVPKSWRGPHLVRINDTFRMFGRNSKGKYIFDATEIRSAFALSEQLPQRIRLWRDDRLATVIGGDAPVPMDEGGRLCIHLAPIASFAGHVEFSAAELDKQQVQFPPLGAGGWNHRVNLDGIVTFTGPRSDTKRSSAYCQVFRSGRVEAVSTRLITARDAQRMIASVWYEEAAIRSIGSYLKGLKQLGAQLPVVVLMTISGVKDAWLAVSQRLMGWDGHTIDRDMLILPDVLVEAYDADVATLLRPVFDAVWNAAGWERSFNYDEHGQWRSHE